MTVNLSVPSSYLHLLLPFPRRKWGANNKRKWDGGSAKYVKCSL